MNRFRLLPPLGLTVMALSALAVAYIGHDTPFLPGQEVAALPERAAPGTDEVTMAFLPPREERNPAAMIDRPLFIEGRKAPEPVVDAPPPQPLPEQEVAVPEPVVEAPLIVEAAPPAPPRIALLGLVVQGQDKAALIRNLEDGTENWMEPGDRIGEWMLAEISQESIRLESGDAEMTFKLFP
jgi:hypothetical protein